MVACSPSEAGCLNYDSHQSIEDENLFSLPDILVNKAKNKSTRMITEHKGGPKTIHHLLDFDAFAAFEKLPVAGLALVLAVLDHHAATGKNGLRLPFHLPSFVG